MAENRTDTVLILNSANATTVNLITGQANFILSDTLSFPDRLPKIALNSFSFTNFFYNITTGVNDKIYYSDDLKDETKYDITIPAGSYSPETLNTFWVNQILADGNAPALCQFLADYSQNKIYIKYGALLGAGWFVHFGALSPFTLLGGVVNGNYPGAVGVPVLNAANEIVYMPLVAAFNNVEALNVKTNLSNNFIYGLRKANTIFSTSPSVSVGSVQIDRPYNLLWSDSDTLRCGISEIVINITDQNDTALRMAENFTTVLQVSY